MSLIFTYVTNIFLYNLTKICRPLFTYLYLALFHLNITHKVFFFETRIILKRYFILTSMNAIFFFFFMKKCNFRLLFFIANFIYLLLVLLLWTIRFLYFIDFFFFNKNMLSVRSFINHFKLFLTFFWYYKSQNKLVFDLILRHDFFS